MALIDRIFPQLETIITNLGGSVPAVGSISDQESRLVNLLSALGAALSTANNIVVSVRVPTPALAIDQHFFIADRGYAVQSILYVHSTPEVTTSNLTCMLSKLGGSDAPASGSPLASANFTCTALANGVQNPNSNGVTLSFGQRLGLKFSGVANELAGVVVAVVLRPV